MSEVSIRVENLSKRYFIGQKPQDVASPYQRLWNLIQKPIQRIQQVRATNLPEFSDEIFWALKDISFEIHQGEVLGIIGHNGAGKSTLLKILTRITKPTSGYAEINGRVGSLLEVGTGFHPELTGRENIYMNGAILGMSRSEINTTFDEIVDFAGVDQFLDTPVKRYSTGMRVRLAFSVAAHLPAEILLVDEVLSVGDLAFQQKSLGKMGEVTQAGRTVLFVSHNLLAVQQLCTKAMLLDKGQIKAFGQTEAVTQQYLKESAPSDRTGLSLLDLPRSTNMGKDLRISKCYPTDNSGEYKPTFRIGESLHFGIEVIANKAVNNVQVAIRIEHSDGIHICTITNEKELFNFEPDVLHRIDLRMDELNLSSGLYNLSISLRQKGIMHFDHLIRPVYFEVAALKVDPSYSDPNGIIVPRTHWQYSTAEPTINPT